MDIPEIYFSSQLHIDIYILHIIMTGFRYYNIIIIIVLFTNTIIVNTDTDIIPLMLNNTATRYHNIAIRICRSVLHYMVVTVNNAILP